MNTAAEKTSRIVVVGDAYVSPATLREAAEKLNLPSAEIIPLSWGSGSKEEFSAMQTEIEHNGPDAVPYPAKLDEWIETADVLLVHFCPLPERLLLRGKKLKLVGVCRGGVENIAVGALNTLCVPLIHIIRNAEAVAEFTVGLILSETRNIARSHHQIMNGGWPTDFPNSAYSSTLKNMTVGIVGLGNIGALVAEKIRALGASAIGFDGYLTPEALKEIPVTPTDSIETVFEQADVITLHLRLTDQNREIVDRKLLSRMKPTAYLVNASRGGLIDEFALCETLQAHRIAGAALDVFADEPLEPSSPLLRLDNITLTPHIAGDTVDAIARSPYLLTEKINAFTKSGDMRCVYNKKEISARR